MAIALSTCAHQKPSPAEVDVELFTFIERYATNLIRWDLLLYFGQHPRGPMEPAEMAREIHRSLKATTKELDDLTYLGVLTRHYRPEKVTYRLSRRGRIRNAVVRLAAYASHR